MTLIDEVEGIAAHRQGDPPSSNQGVTNELLKLIPEFRDRPDRLLICATNFIRSLDAAFLRHGRFDYVIPIGLPDAGARSAIWGKYVPESALPNIDLTSLVELSNGMTPADIEYAARRGSQTALARAMRQDGLSVDKSVTTEDYRDALAKTRATVSDSAVRDFVEDIAALARL